MAIIQLAFLKAIVGLEGWRWSLIYDSSIGHLWFMNKNNLSLLGVGTDIPIQRFRRIQSCQERRWSRLRHTVTIGSIREYPLNERATGSEFLNKR